MLAEMNLPDPNINVAEFYLFDTNVILGLFFENNKRSRHFVSDFAPYRKRLAGAVLDGILKNGCITSAVFSEAIGVSKEHENLDNRTVDERVGKFISNPSMILYKIVTPDSDHKNLQEVYSYLCKNLSRGSRGELSVLMASLISGIPLVVSDDNTLYRSTVRNYIANRFKERFPPKYTKNFDILTSKDFCALKQI